MRRRGRPATQGVDNAIRIANKRGCVMRVQHSPEALCDFLIRTVAFVIFVRTVRFEKIILSVQEVEHECKKIISEIRLFPQSGQIRLELWVYSKHGTFRFFRVTETGLEEIPQDGQNPENTPRQTASLPSPSPSEPAPLPKL